MAEPEEITFRSHPLEEYVQMIERFHGHLAPGVLLGGFMVELAYQQLPTEGLFDAISETPTCLPDAIQLLTPCSAGNGWLQVVDSGRFALTIFEKTTGAGVRVHLDADRLTPGSQLSNWFLKLVPKAEQDKAQLIEEIVQAGSRILSFRKVHVDLAGRRQKKGVKTQICPVCRESYPRDHGPRCRHCSGERMYYRDAS
ncbi:MAG TPA: formylmethanofuran dehydrogenase subunit E family protein [Myxococcota bacterium]|nr:formylmethanofuran dehydrogenase subunit E family protein [Myxococcota bacterium]HRY95690.1 formylmethanofuran dehydrogenase subunit E family protein [Myxococcota bacterium]HSA20194.1 formylmethanofuran dehydrogenase subunit E family protein [Myxococcota bacterium]